MRHKVTVISINNDSIGWPDTLTVENNDGELVNVLQDSLPKNIQHQIDNFPDKVIGSTISVSFMQPVVVEAVDARIDS